MLIPQLVQAMAEYLHAAEALADATDDLIKAHAARPADLMGDCAQFEQRRAAIRLKVYRLARHNWENLQ